MNRLLCSVVLLAALVFGANGSSAEPIPLDGTTRKPFVATLSNVTPVAFGMDVEQTSRALGQHLQYVSGRPGNEIFLAFRNLGGSGLIAHRDRLFLQFRKGRLAGWKEDYGQNWIWR